MSIIELHDAGHEKQDQLDVDTVVDAALTAAGPPIRHIRAQRFYVATDLVTAVEQKLL